MSTITAPAVDAGPIRPLTPPRRTPPRGWARYEGADRQPDGRAEGLAARLGRARAVVAAADEVRRAGNAQIADACDAWIRDQRRQGEDEACRADAAEPGSHRPPAGPRSQRRAQGSPPAVRVAAPVDHDVHPSDQALCGTRSVLTGGAAAAGSA